MKLEVNIEKKYAYGIFGLLLILIGIVGVYAVDTSLPYHSADQIQGLNDLIDQRISAADSGGDSCRMFFNSQPLQPLPNNEGDYRSEIDVPSECLDEKGCRIKITYYDDNTFIERGVRFHDYYQDAKGFWASSSTYMTNGVNHNWWGKNGDTSIGWEDIFDEHYNIRIMDDYDSIETDANKWTYWEQGDSSQNAILYVCSM